jgi:uncharacterized SAM-binding protein YcdF (DUF218 family)
VIDKVLPIFVYPLGLAIVVCFAAIFVARSGRRALASSLAALTVLVLWIPATPIVAAWSTNLLEHRYPPTALEEAEVRDVAIILGGGAAQERVTAAELGSAADRLFQGYLLWRNGKAMTLLVSGGNQPWDSAEKSEANLMVQTLVLLGVPRAAIIEEGASRNTRENALNVTKIWNERGYSSGYLITSASHMGRAEATFRNVGLGLTPWPADYAGGELRIRSVLDLLPDAGALEKNDSRDQGICRAGRLSPARLELGTSRFERCEYPHICPQGYPRS